MAAVLGLGGRLLGALAGRPAPAGCKEELTNLEEETRGLCALVVCVVPPGCDAPAPAVTLYTHEGTIKQLEATYFIGPLRKELSMFFELLVGAALPSIYFDKLIEEFKPPPPVVDCVLG